MIRRLELVRLAVGFVVVLLLADTTVAATFTVNSNVDSPDVRSPVVTSLPPTGARVST
jgi:hypothetical protein